MQERAVWEAAVSFPKPSRKALFPLASGTLILALSCCAAAQGAPQQAAQSASNTPAQTSSVQPSAQLVNSAMPDQPPTLADLSRLARAKKKSEPVKAVKLIDNDNLSHTPRDAAEMAMDASFNSAPSGPGSASSSSSASKGKVTLLDFWATWCGPCRASVPDLKQLQSVYGSDRLEVVSISEDRSERAWQQFVAANGMNWTQRFDAGGEEMRHYGASALPTYIVLDSNGAILGRLVGADPNTPLADRLAPILNR
jgi:thiol-disulfide isomerase/thioredoxin